MYLGKKRRSNKGAVTVVLVLVCAFCVILPLGLAGFEISRFFLIQEELHNITDAAALAGTAAMAGAPSAPTINSGSGVAWTNNDKEYVAMIAAAETFPQNTILKTSFTLGTIAASSDGTPGYTAPGGSTGVNMTVNLNPKPPTAQTPAYHHVALNVLLLNSSGTQVSTGTAADSMQVQAYYTDAPIFIGVPTGWNMFAGASHTLKYTFFAMSNGGLPMIDLMLCFDMSGSMDDMTPCDFVNRYWYYGAVSGTNYGFVNYTDNISTSLAIGLGSAITGTQVNVFPPQNLSYASYPVEWSTEPFYVAGNNHPFCFSETPYSAKISPYSTQTIGLRAANVSTLTSEMSTGNTAGVTGVSTYVSYTSATMPEAGLPPGNYNPSSTALIQEWQYDNSHSTYGNGLDPHAGNNLNSSLPTSATAPRASASNLFTDLVVMPSGGVSGFPVTVTLNSISYNFYNQYQFVEASRGNCESQTIWNQANPSYGAKNESPFLYYYKGTRYTTAPPSGVTAFTCKSGYFDAYWMYVLQQISPMNPAQIAAVDFFSTMHASANCHFGLLGFAGTAGTLAGSTNGDTSVSIAGSGSNETLGPMANIDPNYLASSYTTSFPLPAIALSPTSDNYSLITGSFLASSITQYPPAANSQASLTSNLPLMPTTGTDISDCLNQAISIMQSSSYTRAGATKAIVLFTDGIPDQPSNDFTTGYNDAIAQAKLAASGTPQVPIYTIGLSLNTALTQYQRNLLGDGRTVAHGIINPEGIAYYSAPGVATFNGVTSATTLETAFQQIARSLCAIQ